MPPHTFEYYSTKLKLIKIQVHPPPPHPPGIEIDIEIVGQRFHFSLMIKYWILLSAG